MGDKAIVVADLIAGVLIGIQFFLGEERYKKIDKWLLGKLRKDIIDDGSFRIKAMIIPGALTAIFMLGIIIHGMVTDLVQGNISTGRILLSTTSLVGGTAIGIGILFFTIWLHRKVSCIRKYNPTALVVTIGMLMGTLAIVAFVIAIGKISVHITALITAFAMGVMLMGVWTGGIEYVQRYLTFKGNVLIRFGLLVFVLSKVFQWIYT